MSPTKGLGSLQKTITALEKNHDSWPTCLCGFTLLGRLARVALHGLHTPIWPYFQNRELHDMKARPLDSHGLTHVCVYCLCDPK